MAHPLSAEPGAAIAAPGESTGTYRRVIRLGPFSALQAGLAVLGAALAAASPVAAESAPITVVGKPAAEEALEFELPFRLRDSDGLDRLLEAQATPGAPEYQRFLTPAEFRARFGITDETAAAATRLLREAGLEVTARHAQGLRVRGPVVAVERAFGARFALVRAPADRRAIPRSLTVPALPAGLAALGARTPELASLPRARAGARRADLPPPNRQSPVGPYWYNDLKQAYAFPSYRTVTGKGRTIAVIAASDVNRADLDLYFGHEGLATPAVFVRRVLGGSPFDPGSEQSFEMDIDLQQAGGMAPGATLIGYDLPGSSPDAVLAGLFDIVEDDLADIVSYSLNSCEDFYSPAYGKALHLGLGYGMLDAHDDLFRQGNAQGMTFVVISGDFGARDCVSLANILDEPTDPPHVAGRATLGINDVAGSSHVTVVGGTNLVTTAKPGSLDSAYVRENARAEPLLPVDLFGTGNLVANAVWGSGGGLSKHFPAPPYQKGLTGSRFRAVPDLAMHMGGCPLDAPQPCPGELSGDVAAFDGGITAAIGTSLAAPDFAGALALQEEALGGKRLGNINPRLYALAARNATGHYFHQDIPGNNGGYRTTPGYNEVLGNGTPIVKNLIGLPNDPGAGTPQTPSNP